MSPTSTLNDQQFDSSSAVLVPLVTNSATLDAVGQTVPGDNRLFPGNLSEAAIYGALASLKGKSAFLLGHVENDAFVIRDSSGVAISTLSIDALQPYGEKNGINIYAVGCNSAAVGGTGAAGTFNTVDAVNRFSSALGAKTWGAFYSSFAGQNLALVVDQSSIAQDGSGRTHINIFRTAYGRYLLAGAISTAIGATASALGNRTSSNSSQNSKDDGWPWWVWVLGLFGVLAVGRRILWAL